MVEQLDKPSFVNYRIVWADISQATNLRDLFHAWR
jgi:hypothetical protein